MRPEARADQGQRQGIATWHARIQHFPARQCSGEIAARHGAARACLRCRQLV